MGLIQRLLFNFWYFRNPPWDTGVSPPELLAYLQNHSPGRALDLGCGTGTNVICLARHGWQVTGVDFVPRAIRMAREKARRAGVQADLRVGDVTRLSDLSGPYDLVLDMGCFHSLSPHGRQAYVKNVERLLAPGGSFLLYVFFKEDPGAAGPGVSQADLEILSESLDLSQRTDGTERGVHPSAWLTYQK